MPSAWLGSGFEAWWRCCWSWLWDGIGVGVVDFGGVSISARVAEVEGR